RAVASASAMPSISGILMSVSSRSKRPCSRVRMSSASAPSTAVTPSWPASASARAVSARSASSSSAIRIRAMTCSWSRCKSSLSLAENRCPLFPASLLSFLDDADERQLAILVRHVHAIADDEQVRAMETDEVRVERHRALAGLFQQHASEHAFRAARGEQILGIGERAAGFENIVDQHDVAAAHIAFDVMQDRHDAG